VTATSPEYPSGLQRHDVTLEGARLFVALALIISLVATASNATGAVLGRVAIAGLLNLMLVLGLYLYSGTSGVMSFGHLAFALLGAYVGGILAIQPAVRMLLLPDLPGPLARVAIPVPFLPLVAAAGAAVLAVPIGLLMTRLNGIVGSIGTFSLLVITHEIASNLRSTNGAAGVSGVPVTASLPIVLVWTVVVLGVTVAFKQSRTGLRLRASKDDLLAAQAVGIRVRHHRLQAWTLSAAVSGAAGALYAAFVGSFTPDSLYLSTTTLIIAMLVVGGTASVSGAVLGALVLTVLYDRLQYVEVGMRIGVVTTAALPGLAEIGLALVMLFTLWWRPQGLTAGREVLPFRGVPLHILREFRRRDPMSRSRDAPGSARHQ